MQLPNFNLVCMSSLHGSFSACSVRSMIAPKGSAGGVIRGRSPPPHPPIFSARDVVIQFLQTILN